MELPSIDFWNRFRIGEDANLHVPIIGGNGTQPVTPEYIRELHAALSLLVKDRKPFQPLVYQRWPVGQRWIAEPVAENFILTDDARDGTFTIWAQAEIDPNVIMAYDLENKVHPLYQDSKIVVTPTSLSLNYIGAYTQIALTHHAEGPKEVKVDDTDPNMMLDGGDLSSVAGMITSMYTAIFGNEPTTVTTAEAPSHSGTASDGKSTVDLVKPSIWTTPYLHVLYTGNAGDAYLLGALKFVEQVRAFCYTTIEGIAADHKRQYAPRDPRDRRAIATLDLGFTDTRALDLAAISRSVRDTGDETGRARAHDPSAPKGRHIALSQRRGAVMEALVRR